MKTSPDSFSKNYANWSAVGWAMLLGHAPATPGKKASATPALPPALRKTRAKKRPAIKAKAKRRR